MYPLTDIGLPRPGDQVSDEPADRVPEKPQGKAQSWPRMQWKRKAKAVSLPAPLHGVEHCRAFDRIEPCFLGGHRVQDHPAP